MRLLGPLTAALVAALIAAGCGGSDDSSVETKGELIAKGDAICKKGIAQVRTEAAAYMKKKGNPGVIKNNAQYTELNETILLPSLQQQTDELRALGVPDGEEEAVEEVLDAFDTGIKKGVKDPESLFSGQNPLAKANNLAGKYGFKVCGVN